MQLQIGDEGPAVFRDRFHGIAAVYFPQQHVQVAGIVRRTAHAGAETTVPHLRAREAHQRRHLPAPRVDPVYRLLVHKHAVQRGVTVGVARAQPKDDLLSLQRRLVQGHAVAPFFDVQDALGGREDSGFGRHLGPGILKGDLFAARHGAVEHDAVYGAGRDERRLFRQVVQPRAQRISSDESHISDSSPSSNIVSSGPLTGSNPAR